MGKYYYPSRGGIESYTKTISEGARNGGMEVDVLVSNKGFNYKKNKINGIEVERLRRISNFMNQPLSPGLLMKSFDNYDIVHLNLPNPFAAFCLSRKKIRKLVITYHSDIIKYGLEKQIVDLYKKTYLRKILEKADRIIATSQRYVDSSECLSEFLDKVEIIPLGINIKRFERSEKKVKELKKKMDIKNKQIGLFVGRLIPYKGLEYLIEAVSLIEERDLVFLVIGEGPLEKKLKDKCKKLGVDNKIFFLGRVEELVPYYRLCDFFVLPSVYRAEAFGIVQLEAMASGKPVISTNLDSGVPFVNKNMVSGLVVEPKNAEELSEAIKKLINNKKLRDKFGRNGKKRVEKLFTEEKMIKKTLDVYRELFNK